MTGLHLRTVKPDEFAERLDRTLATAITPIPWEASDDIGVEWWTVRLPDGGIIAGYDGIGTIALDRFGAMWRIEYAVACPGTPGTDERRAWLCAAIRALAPDAIMVDAGRMARGGAA